MANFSIPSSTRATGPTSTISSRRSKKLSKQARFDLSLAQRCALRFQKRHQAAALQSAVRARKIPRWTLDVGHWTFFSSRRVKGAWWPSRSSKPSSPCKWRGRFDSYPLRLCRFDGRWLSFDFGFNFVGGFKSNIKLQTSNIEGGGESHVA